METRLPEVQSSLPACDVPRAMVQDYFPTECGVVKEWHINRVRAGVIQFLHNRSTRTLRTRMRAKSTRGGWTILRMMRNFDADLCVKKEP